MYLPTRRWSLVLQKCTYLFISLVMSFVLVPPAVVRLRGGHVLDVVEGQNYNISCYAERSNPPVTFQWFKNGEVVSRECASLLIPALMV